MTSLADLGAEVEKLVNNNREFSEQLNEQDSLLKKVTELNQEMKDENSTLKKRVETLASENVAHSNNLEKLESDLRK